jgi:hypothetical protein
MDKGIYGRKDRLIKEKRHDTYQKEDKWPENTTCTQCGALFVNGRWTWQKASKKANKTVCPACKRIIDNYPAGYVDIKGKFFTKHFDEITNLILNIEKQETSQHPLERIISITGTKSHNQITTTGIHIARRIGEALSSAYKGELSVQYADAEQSVRVSWQR